MNPSCDLCDDERDLEQVGIGYICARCKAKQERDVNAWQFGVCLFTILLVCGLVWLVWG